MNKNTQQIFNPFEVGNGNIPKKIQLLPAGNSIKGRDGRTWTIKDIHELAQISNDYLPLHCIDENHATDLKATKGEQSPAFGWFSNISVEQDGSLWADVEWTARGIEALEKKDYKYISPVFSNDEFGNITVIMRAALTNTPNLDLVSLNSENADIDYSEDFDAFIKKLAEILSLKSNTSANDIIKAVEELKDNNTNLNAGIISELTQRALNAESQIKTFAVDNHKKEVELFINEAVRNAYITPANKEYYTSLCSTTEGFNKVKEIIKNSAPIISNIPQFNHESSNIQNTNDDSDFISSIGYTAEQWDKIKKFAKKR